MVTTRTFCRCLSIGILLGIGCFGYCRCAVAQPWTSGAESPLAARTHAAGRGAIARLVRNPDQSGVTPPFALADQNGTIQRYVEPLPSIDLAPYVGQIVTVRHDTGRTLLASQLELPFLPLDPTDPGRAGPSAGAGQSNGGGPESAAPAIQQAAHIDEDDTTVELLDEPETMTELEPQPSYGALEPLPDGAMGPVLHDPYIPYGAPSCPPGGCSPVAHVGPCPQCGGYHTSGFLGPVPQSGYGNDRPHVYADLEINFLRTHVAESAVGKLSEKYEFSPRFVLGFEGVGNLAGRARYWTYDRTNHTLGDDELGVEFDVYDFEATHRFRGQRTEIVIGGGLRLARIELEDDNGADSGCDLLGITFAADGHTPLIMLDQGTFGWAYGVRASLLAGDWGGDDNSLIVDGRDRDDNVVQHEMYGGLEYRRRLRRADVHAQLVFEMQNWHSDVLSERSSIESISFIGPGLRLGAEF